MTRRGGEEAKSALESAVISEASRLFLLGVRGRGRRGRDRRRTVGGVWRSCRWRLSAGGFLRVGCRILENGSVFENAASVFGDGLYAGSVGGVRGLDAAVVRASGFVNVAVKAIEKAAEQQAGIGGEHGVIHGIEVQVARRAQASRQLGVVALVLQVKLMGCAEGFARDLPGADGVVADHDALAAATKNDVVALGALLPDGMGEIAVHVHVIVLHSADAEKVVERKRIELGNVENVGGELGGLLASQGAGSGVGSFHYAVIGLRLENKKPGQRGEKLKRAEGFEFLLGGDTIGNVERVALLLVVGKVLFRPGIQLVAGDQIAAFELSKVRDGGEQIVVADNEDFVGRTCDGIDGRQQDARGVISAAAMRGVNGRTSRLPWILGAGRTGYRGACRSKGQRR